MKEEKERFLQDIDRQSLRKKRFEKAGSVWRHTMYGGVLGLVFVLPIIAGAYLGRWLDTRASGYSISWTINLILLGVIVGSINAYLFVKERL